MIFIAHIWPISLETLDSYSRRGLWKEGGETLRADEACVGDNDNSLKPSLRQPRSHSKWNQINKETDERNPKTDDKAMNMLAKSNT